MTFSSSTDTMTGGSAGYPAAYTAYTAPRPPFSSTAVDTPAYFSSIPPGAGGVIPVSYSPVSPVYSQYYCVQPLPEAERPRKCLLRIVCEAVGWLTSAVLCTLCSAACGAASCCIDTLQEEECLPGKPQHY